MILDVSSAYNSFREKYIFYKAIVENNEQGFQLYKYDKDNPQNIKLYIHNNNDYAERLSNAQKEPIKPNFSLNSTNIAYKLENWEIFYTISKKNTITLDIHDIIVYGNYYLIIYRTSDKRNQGNYIRYTGRKMEKIQWLT